jgi:hypothetical protein
MQDPFWIQYCQEVDEQVSMSAPDMIEGSNGSFTIRRHGYTTYEM